MLTPTPHDIDAAAARIAGRVRVTPILEVEAEAFGLPCPVTFKLEHTQITGSFKVRGAFNNMLSREVPEAGVVAASGGNHGAAVAHAATSLGHRSRIFVPKSIAKEEKLRRMRQFGGEVILTEGTVADCMSQYAQAAEDSGALSVHPYDTEWTLAGQGTVAREFEEQMGGIDTILVATGGGGLIGGIAAWFGDRVNVVSVETEGTDTLARSLREGPDVAIEATGIAAGSLGGPRLGVQSWDVIRDRVKTALVLPDEAVYEAARKLWEATRLVGEPGAAVALAALTSRAYVPQKDERLAVLLCGGNADVDWFIG
ncbi:threonine/serine dehydratase [Roseibacterium sp. SDUM158017]|uniref:threonine/serine dehydratase n=1 Tax=Roseicyclus salinarum TaxID=3036773 RepID=UPI0024153D55|nr:threonine/serine dehydratase [Roseibacterium sp. SDUM158017]MDG4647671.1 threonine/serine dehydratase [Roseibacterium sp. SDUM158017]